MISDASAVCHRFRLFALKIRRSSMKAVSKWRIIYLTYRPFRVLWIDGELFVTMEKKGEKNIMNIITTQIYFKNSSCVWAACSGTYTIQKRIEHKKKLSWRKKEKCPKFPISKGINIREVEEEKKSKREVYIEIHTCAQCVSMHFKTPL